METVEMIQRVLRLKVMLVQPRNCGMARVTHVHNIVKHYKCCPFRLSFIPYAYLSDATVSSEEVIQVFSCDLVVQVFDEQDTVRARGEFRLRGMVRTP